MRSYFKKVIFITIIALMMAASFAVNAQVTASEFKPYTIESTYAKLKKAYPFITPIAPLNSVNIRCEENVVYKTIDTTKLRLDIYVPRNKLKEPYPAVLLIHGGGWLTGSKENQRIMAQHLALNGYIAVTANYRLGLAAPYPAAVIDLKDAIKWMRVHAKTYGIDSEKIAVLGASAGGQLASLIGVTPNSPVYGFDKSISDEVQAIINIDGIVSFIHPEAAAEGKMASIWLSGSKADHYKNWKEASPLEYVNRRSPPTLFINSEQARFHAGRDDMIKRLEAYNIYNETHTIPESPHSFWLVHPWFELTLEYSINFLNKTLKNSH